MGLALDAKTKAKIERLALDGLTKSEIGRQLGLRRDTVAKYWPDGVPHPDVHRVEQSNPIEAQRKKSEADKQRKEHIAAVKELAFRDVLREQLEKLAPALEPPPIYKPRKPPKDVVTETILLHASDWHLDEIVRAEQVFGLNEFNREVADRRVKRITDATIEIKTRLESGGYRLPTLVVAANGDMVSGTIHELERHTDGANIMVTALRCATLFASMIRDLSAHFERVFVFGTSGNHGRLGDAKKVQVKEPTRSWDYLIYTHAAALLRECKNVVVEAPDSWAVMYELEGKLFYQGHGHFVKSWNSIPFYGINRMTSRLGAVLAKYFRPVDYWLFGHFHVHGSIENAGGEYLINPPLIGPQEFGLHSFGDAVPPGQTLYGVHAKHGLTHRWRLAAEAEWPPTNRKLSAKRISSV